MIWKSLKPGWRPDTAVPDPARIPTASLSMILNWRMASAAFGKWKKKNKTVSLAFFSPVRQSELAIIKETAEALWNDLSKIEVMA